MRSFVNFIFGLLSGAVVGIAAALLLAPYSGHQLRSNMMSRYEGTLSNLRTAIEEERHKLEDELETLTRGEIQLS